MFEINVDLSGLSGVMDDVRINGEVLQKGLMNAAVYVRDVWRSAVLGNTLPGMSRAVQDEKYASALATGDAIKLPSLFSAIVAPVGYADGVQEIEDGYGPFDMKTEKHGGMGGLLTGPKARPTADGLGKYNIIPFRHYTPQPASAGASAIAIKMRMPDEVYKEAKKLPLSTPKQGGGVNWNTSLNWPEPIQTSFTGYTHTTSIYDNMYRIGNPGHVRYMTFRTVSTPRMDSKGHKKGSDPLSWWNPGAPPNHVIEAVYNFCMPKVTENLIKLIESY